MLLSLVLMGAATAASCDDLAERLEHSFAGEHPSCLTDQLLALRAQAERDGAEACFDSSLHAIGLALRGDVPNLPAPPELGLRDVYGLPNLYETEHFAIRYGNSHKPSASQLQRLGQSFEQSWASEVVTMGFPRPDGAFNYKMNIYLGDTGDGAPPIPASAAGYFWYDSASYPMIVMRYDLRNPSAYELTASHEFFHAVQAAINTYQYAGQGAWYYEATSSWIEVEVFPTNPGYANFLFGWAFQPELPVNYFDYPDQGRLTEYHQYGAFIFIRYLAEFHGGWQIIQRSFLEADFGSDPLVELDRILLETEGIGVDEAYRDFAARSAAWDFEHRSIYTSYINQAGGWNSSWSARPSGIVNELNATHSPNYDLPQTFGANYWQLSPNLPGQFEVLFEGDPGTDWYIAVEALEGNTFTRFEATLDGTTGSLDVPDLPSFDEAWLVVAATGDYTWTTGTTFDYSFELVEYEPPVDTGLDDTGDTDEPYDGSDDLGGCSCASPAAPGLSWLFALGGLGLLRRRSLT